MASFSKQWCDLYDPEMPHDFDIEQIAKKLEPGYYRSEICEGFGFLAILKTESGNIELLFKDYDNGDNHEWLDYGKFMQSQKQLYDKSR